MATNNKRGKRTGKAQEQAQAHTASLDDVDFDNVDDASDDSPEELEEAIAALGDPDVPDKVEEPPPKWEETANGKTLYVRDPIMVQKSGRRIHLGIGQRVPKGLLSRDRLRTLGRRGLISVKPPPRAQRSA